MWSTLGQCTDDFCNNWWHQGIQMLAAHVPSGSGSSIVQAGCCCCCRTKRLPLDGKVFLVTGSTDGIGKHTSGLLLRQGATVLLHGR